MKMPPGNKSLSSEELETLKKWILEGAPFPTGHSLVKRPEPSWWAFKKPQRPPVPKTRDPLWVRNPIDAFILAKLEENRLDPALPVDKRSLLRRAYFDLIGLPPTQQQVDAFLKDSSSNAYEKLVDELLASPQYGERWGRHWLDVVRYADTSGYEGDIYYPNAWRYRDYVIKSFNDDKPYDRFLQEQIAGDELWPDRFELLGSRTLSLETMEYLEARVGTGLYSLGPKILESDSDARMARNEKFVDWVDTTGAAFLGLTVGCARCHDHKFDPISQRDYYRLQAIFANSKQIETPLIPQIGINDHNVAYSKVIELDEARTAYRSFLDEVKRRFTAAKKKEFSPEVVTAFEIPEAKRTPEQQKLAAPLVEALKSVAIDKMMTADEQQRHQQLTEKLAKAVVGVPEGEGNNGVKYDGLFEIPTASVLDHYPAELVPEVYVLNRGDLDQPKEKAGPGLPSALGDEMDEVSDSERSRPRKQLALWLSRPSHPLTARVMVNRIWQWHFGQGIVATPNDYGRKGLPPTHPELLDWLATEFVARGWSIKSMHRLIMLSNAYQMDSRYDNKKNARIDPSNRFLWRMNRRRLEGEALWDSMHAVSGTLDLTM